uniref:Uncharacterized protein n=1 Tax=Mustela putorius furo TaxID=9669 RepID=M3YM30_MUSPF
MCAALVKMLLCAEVRGGGFLFFPICLFLDILVGGRYVFSPCSSFSVFCFLFFVFFSWDGHFVHGWIGSLKPLDGRMSLSDEMGSSITKRKEGEKKRKEKEQKEKKEKRKKRSREKGRTIIPELRS